MNSFYLPRLYTTNKVLVAITSDTAGRLANNKVVNLLKSIGRNTAFILCEDDNIVM